MKKILFITFFLFLTNFLYSQSCSPTLPARFAIIGLSSAIYDYDANIQIIGTLYNGQPSSQATITLAFENLNPTTTYYTYYINGSYLGFGTGQFTKSFVVPITCSGSPQLSFNLKVHNNNNPSTAGNVKVSILSISGGTVESGYSSFTTNWHP